MTRRGLESILSVQPIMKEAFESSAHPSWSKDDLKKIDVWIKGQDNPAMGRSEAVRRLVELGLKAKGK
jgi:hypothetical protein